MTIALRALTANEIAALDQVPPLTGAPLGFPDPSLFVPLGQWLDALYRQASGATPGAGTFTTLVATTLTLPGGSAGGISSTSTTLPMTLLSNIGATGSATDPAFSLLAQSNLAGNQPILSLFNDADGTPDEVFTVLPDGTTVLKGGLRFDSTTLRGISGADAVTVGIVAPSFTPNLTISAGGAASATASLPGVTGPQLILGGGVGGVSSATQVAGAGGNVAITGGSAGADLAGGGGNNGGHLLLDGGAATSLGQDGNVKIGTTAETFAIDLGRAACRLGAFGATPVAQPSTTGQTAGFTAGAGTAVLSDSTFTGGAGTKAYTIGDVVKHLKALGLLASS